MAEETLQMGNTAVAQDAVSLEPDKPTVAVRKRAVRAERQEMPAQGADERVSNFEEVNLGFSDVVALIEASRCLQCKKPVCIDGCPVAVDIPRFIAAVSAGNVGLANEIIREANVLPCATGRVCPQEMQCERECVLAKKGESVAIGHLERYVADWAMQHSCRLPSYADPTGIKIAIVGSGPGGLACAGELNHRGHEVTVFEALHAPGGVLRYGIPEFRLPRKVVEQEVQKLRELGVKIVCNTIIGSTFTLDDLLQQYGFSAVYLACGAGVPLFLNIPGENLKGVYSANEYLTRVNLMGAGPGGRSATPVLTGPDMVVVGGGNTALDACRTARRLGAQNVTVAYRRSRAEMPARAEETRHAEEEGVRFEFLANPVEIVGDKDGWVQAIRCIRMELGEPDISGRRRPSPIAGSEFEIPCKVVVVAVGTTANPLLTRHTPALKLNRHGYVEVDDIGMTSMRGIFAGGDLVRGAASVILAMGDGKKAAAAIHQFVSNKSEQVTA